MGRKLVCPGEVEMIRHDHHGSDLPHWHVGWSEHEGGPHGMSSPQTLYDWEAEVEPSGLFPLRQDEVWLVDPIGSR